MKGRGYVEDIVTCHAFHVPCSKHGNSASFAEASALHDRHSGFAMSLRGCLLWHCCGFGVCMLGYVCEGEHVNLLRPLLRLLRNTFPFTSTHTSPTSPLSLSLSLMVSGPVLPLVDMWRTLAQRATQTTSLGKFSSLYHNDLLMSLSSSYKWVWSCPEMSSL